MVLTDSETRVYLSGLPYGGQGQNNYFATLDVNVSQSYDMYTANQQTSSDGLFIIFDNMLVGQHGSWTLDVQQVMSDPPNGHPPQMSQGGHWVFHFQVP